MRVLVDSSIRPDLAMWAWQVDALCRGLPSDVFYPPDNERGGSKRRREDHAKRICRACPVLEVCRSHAVDVGEPYGVWGAMTPAERQPLRAKRGQEPAVTPVPTLGWTARCPAGSR